MIQAGTLALALLAGGFAGPQFATMTMWGTVPSVCTLSGDVAAAGDGALETRLSVFCNQREGSTVTGMISGDDPQGYLVRFGARTMQVPSDATFEIARYSDAFAGSELLTISPLSGETGAVPAVTFDIRAGA